MLFFVSRFSFSDQSKADPWFKRNEELKLREYGTQVSWDGFDEIDPYNNPPKVPDLAEKRTRNQPKYDMNVYDNDFRKRIFIIFY